MALALILFDDAERYKPQAKALVESIGAEVTTESIVGATVEHVGAEYGLTHSEADTFHKALVERWS